MTDWTCRCGARNEAPWRYCEGCGAESPRRQETAETPAEARRPAEPSRPPPTEAEWAANKAAVREMIAMLAQKLAAEKRAPRPEVPVLDAGERWFTEVREQAKGRRKP